MRPAAKNSAMLRQAVSRADRFQSVVQPPNSTPLPMNKSVSCLITTAAAGLLAVSLNAHAVVWDGFQSYSDSQVLATNATILMGDSSSRWTRVGNASSNPQARSNYGPYGDTVCRFSPTWNPGAGNEWAIMAYNFQGPQDLTATPGMSVKLMTTSLPPTNTLVQAEFVDAGGNIWQTKAGGAQALSSADSWRTVTFAFDPWAMDEVVGTDAFDLTAITQVRIRFSNSSGDSSSQDIYIDDFQSFTPVFSQAIVYDNFQSYANGQVLATNASVLMGDGSSPWTRTGLAVSSNPQAKNSFGSLPVTVCDFAPVFSGANNLATLVFNFPTVSNLTAIPGLSVKLMPTSLPPGSNTLVYAEIVGTNATANIWRTKPAAALALNKLNTWQTFAFAFRSSTMDLVNGSGAFDLSAVKAVRLRFLNNGGDGNPQHIYISSFGGPLAAAEAQGIAWDTFQSYTNNQILATSAISQPSNAPSMWGQFGPASSNGYMVGKTGYGFNGDVVGDYALKFSLGNNANLCYYFPAASNLTATPGFSAKLMVTNLTAVTSTLVYAVVEQTNTVNQTATLYQTKAGLTFASAYNWQTFAFNFSPATLVLSSGPNEPLDLTSVRDVRLRFINSGGDTTSQHVYVDALESYPPKPAGPAAPPQPFITQITPGSGNSLSIQFTSPDNAAASAFLLETNSVLGVDGGWAQDTGATIQSVGTGVYQSDTTTPDAPSLFYRIRR